MSTTSGNSFGRASNSHLLDVKTKETVQNFFRLTYNTDVVNKTVDLNDWMHDYSTSGHGSLTGVIFYQYSDTQEVGDTVEMEDYSGVEDNSEVEGLYRNFTGFRFAGLGQDPEAEKRTDSPWLNSTFQLDTSVNISRWQSGWESGWEEEWKLEPVPYNSTPSSTSQALYREIWARRRIGTGS